MIVFKTTDLQEICKKNGAKYNRRLLSKTIKKFTNDWCVVQFTMPHFHAKGEPVKQHTRVMFLASTDIDCERPTQYIVDMSNEQFKKISFTFNNEGE